MSNISIKKVNEAEKFVSSLLKETNQNIKNDILLNKISMPQKLIYSKDSKDYLKNDKLPIVNYFINKSKVKLRETQKNQLVKNIKSIDRKLLELKYNVHKEYPNKTKQLKILPIKMNKNKSNSKLYNEEEEDFLENNAKNFIKKIRDEKKLRLEEMKSKIKKKNHFVIQNLEKSLDDVRRLFINNKDRTKSRIASEYKKNYSNVNLRNNNKKINYFYDGDNKIYYNKDIKFIINENDNNKNNYNNINNNLKHNNSKTNNRSKFSVQSNSNINIERFPNLSKDFNEFEKQLSNQQQFIYNNNNYNEFNLNDNYPIESDVNNNYIVGNENYLNQQKNNLNNNNIINNNNNNNLNQFSSTPSIIKKNNSDNNNNANTIESPIILPNIFSNRITTNDNNIMNLSKNISHISSRSNNINDKNNSNNSKNIFNDDINISNINCVGNNNVDSFNNAIIDYSLIKKSPYYFNEPKYEKIIEYKQKYGSKIKERKLEDFNKQFDLKDQILLLND